MDCQALAAVIPAMLEKFLIFPASQLGLDSRQYHASEFAHAAGQQGS